MLNEFAYCPRLSYLEWIEQEWDDNVWTLDGEYQHRRVDRPSEGLPDAETIEGGDETTIHARSVTLSAPDLGLIARMDLIEADGGEVIPVEYKRGSVPDNEEQSWEPERIQLAVQVLILRENGYSCSRGVLYYVSSKRRVDIIVNESLALRTLELADQLRQVAASGQRPAPLVDSPKCAGCSLVGICLPDETLFMTIHEGGEAEEDAIRRLYPARDDTLPLYVQEQGAYVGKSGEEITVKKKGEVVAKARLMELSQLCLYGSVQISTQAVHEFLTRSIPILYFSYGGWFHGLCTGLPHKNIELRRSQYQAAGNGCALVIARQLVNNKVQNCRVLLRRNADSASLDELRWTEKKVMEAGSLESLLGYEGTAARIYFQQFASMIKAKEAESGLDSFDFQSRNRRPPKDPVNALLSYAYSLLVKDWTITLLTVGLDPYLGFYHQPRYGRPALALDMMEPFRPLIADSTVLTAINTGVIQPNDFVRSGGAVALKPEARKRFILAYERRMNTLITHPIFNYRVSYRRILEVQARLLARYLIGEIKTPPEFTTR